MYNKYKKFDDRGVESEMPRFPRSYIQTSYFHIITQGINKSYIFDKKEDIEYYIELMKRVAKKENVDIMIDDDWKIIKKLADNYVKTLYFRDTNLKKLDENEYIREVNNWGEIYRIIKGGI